jgi:hypothetical protein
MHGLYRIMRAWIASRPGINLHSLGLLELANLLDVVHEISSIHKLHHKVKAILEVKSRGRDWKERCVCVRTIKKSQDQITLLFLHRRLIHFSQQLYLPVNCLHKTYYEKRLAKRWTQKYWSRTLQPLCAKTDCNVIPRGHYFPSIHFLYKLV